MQKIPTRLPRRTTGLGAGRGGSVVGAKIGSTLVAEPNSRPVRIRQKRMLSRQAGIPSIPSLRRQFGSRNYDERVAGGGSSLRPPDPALESENEGVYFRRAQRNPHH